MNSLRLFWAEITYLIHSLAQADLLDSNPINLLILLLAGGGVIYVVLIFTRAQTIREREMLAAQTAREERMLAAQAAREKELLATVRELRDDDRKMTERWLVSTETISRDGNDAIHEIASRLEQLTAAINRSIEHRNSGGSRRETKQ